ncbi:hypothetical protein KIP88_02455 [Bradyrhizobium sp. SRL28]|uniref:hypothetical protein n=1 Tax=Bradyrhizobium sp. SRL28 TaxID=2836178 RepID=UPI001BDE7720|nr:hypothetical protein [Bradyrhizobium sp. SRL28]MBT1509351.1 hypothetical protein [Bradyrhizobium sp. SRL28]
MTKKPKPMSEKQFKAALKRLGLTVASQQTSRLLGVGIRHNMRIAKGEKPVPRPIELLLKMYLQHGVGE